MRTDDKCLRAFIELRAFSRGSINDHWNVQVNPLAPPVFRPSFCMSEFLVVHTNNDSRYFPVWPQMGMAFQTSTSTDAFIKCGQGTLSPV
jgi:hypothetical protein